MAPKPELAGARDTDRAMGVEVIRFRRKRPIDPSNPFWTAVVSWRKV